MKSPAPAKSPGPGRRSTGHRSGHTAGSTKKTPQKKYTKAQTRAFNKYIRQQRRAGLALDGMPSCTFIAAAELIHMQTGVQLAEHVVTDAFLDTGPADRGRIMQDALAYWHEQGIGGHKIEGFNRVDPLSAKPLYLSLAVPPSALEQFLEGEIWDDVGDQELAGYHAVAYHKGYVTTWGRVQEVTPAFLWTYTEEAWVVF